MILCRADAISRHYTQQPVFADVSFQIESGERIGLVGPNGAGKTTLLRVLCRNDPPDTGAIHFAADVRVAYLSQFPDFDPNQTLAAEVRRAMAHLEAWYQQMVEAGAKLAETTDPIEHGKWSRQYDHYQELLRRHGGYEFDHRIEEVLFGLGFSREDFERPLATFSGGQQSRVTLGRLLLSSPDLMLLDEPTNHLDIDTTEWLEDYLVRQDAAIVIVSHDRYFLDKTVTRVIELHRGRLTSYPGNYQSYVTLRAERQKVAERIQTKQRETLAHYEDFVARNSYGQLAKQAKSREKMIARIESEMVETLAEVEAPQIGFGNPTRAGDIVVSVRELSKAFGPNRLFENVNFEIERGERVGLVGANGTGKTTLLRILLGMEPATSGTAKLGHNVRVGYLDQDLQLLDPEQTPLEAVRPPWRVTEKAEPFRALLARYGLGADFIERRLGTMSGGERSRVALARIEAFEVNLLALDEPTNHLDLWAREALEKAIQQFEGTVLVVSHDRYFLNQVVDRLLIVEAGSVRSLAGNYDAFQRDRKERQARATGRSAPKGAAAPSSPEPGARRAKRKFPFRKVVDIEADIADHESKIASLEASLQTPEVYTNGRKLHEVSQALEAARAALETLYEHWAEAIERNPS